MSKQTVTLELEVPKGWEYVEYRIPEADDYVLFIHKLEPEPFSTSWIPIHPCPVYRKLLPDTLTVELPRGVFEWFRDMKWYEATPNDHHDPCLAVSDACKRAALKAEGQA